MYRAYKTTIPLNIFIRN